MKRLLSIVLFITLTINSLCQSKCDVIQKDSIELYTFGLNFKKAVMARDMEEISTFFQFPFICHSCQPSDSLDQEKRITKDAFTSTKYKDFFGDWFMETVSKPNIYDFLDSDQVNNKCILSFSYTMKTSRNAPDINCSFQIEKVRGKYKITSGKRLP